MNYSSIVHNMCKSDLRRSQRQDETRKEISLKVIKMQKYEGDHIR